MRVFVCNGQITLSYSGIVFLSVIMLTYNEAEDEREYQEQEAVLRVPLYYDPSFSLKTQDCFYSPYY